MYTSAGRGCRSIPRGIPDGWFDTGDLGEIDDRRHAPRPRAAQRFDRDRRRERLPRRGGEQRLEALPGVRRARWCSACSTSAGGSFVAAAARARSGHRALLAGGCRRRRARLHKRPRLACAVALPLTGSGKLAMRRRRGSVTGRRCAVRRVRRAGALSTRVTPMVRCAALISGAPSARACGGRGRRLRLRDDARRRPPHRRRHRRRRRRSTRRARSPSPPPTRSASPRSGSTSTRAGASSPSPIR